MTNHKCKDKDKWYNSQWQYYVYFYEKTINYKETSLVQVNDTKIQE